MPIVRLGKDTILVIDYNATLNVKHWEENSDLGKADMYVQRYSKENRMFGFNLERCNIHILTRKDHKNSFQT